MAGTEKPELVHVPDVAELVHIQLARPVAWSEKGKATHFTITPAGQKMINDAMLENGRRMRDWNDANPSNVELARRARADARSWADQAFTE